jgi:predicted PolB exonuclease-like 3'-5' exonuclease
MLAFDIETTGLDPRLHTITVAAICNKEEGIQKCYNFLMGNQDDKEEFMKQLDDADSLCSFNGVLFDLPFIIKRFNVPPERYEPWFLKLFDYYHICKNLFNSSFSLNTLLLANGFSPKLASGTQAIQWAKNGQHEKLMEYCQDDANLTYDISVAQTATLPLKNEPHVIAHKKGGSKSITYFQGDI